MTMTFPVAQMRITRDLRDAETALDDALLKQSSLLSTMVTVRREADLGAFTGHEALLRLTKSQHTLVSAAGDLARVHGGLLEVQRDVTGQADCPPGVTKPTGFGEDDIAAVAG